MRHDHTQRGAGICMWHSRPRLWTPSRGFTLIELLIVIAILAILAASMLDVQTHLLRQEAKERLGADLADNCQSVIETVARDLGRADAVALPAAADGGALLRLSVPADPGDAAGATRIEYRLSGGELHRACTYPGPGAQSTDQVLAHRLEQLTLERRGSLLRVAVQAGGHWIAEDIHENLATEFCVTNWRDLP